MGSEKSIEYNRNFGHDEIDWNTPQKIIVNHKRKIIAFLYISYWKERNRTMLYEFPVCCQKNKFEEILSFFKERMPNLPCEEGRISFQFVQKGVEGKVDIKL